MIDGGDEVRSAAPFTPPIRPIPVCIPNSEFCIS